MKISHLVLLALAGTLISCDGRSGAGARTGQEGGPTSESGRPDGPSMQSRTQADDAQEATKFKPDSAAAGSTGNVPK